MEVVEDMKLGKLIKNAGFRSGLGMAPESVWLRWYSGAGNIVRGLTKNMFAALNFSVPLALFHLAQMFVACIVPFLGLALGSGWVRVFAAIAVAVMLAFHAGACRRTKVSMWYALTDPLGTAILSLDCGAVDVRDAGARGRGLAGDVLSDRGVAARVGVGIRGECCRDQLRPPGLSCELFVIFLGAPRFRIALGKQFVQSVARPLLRSAMSRPVFHLKATFAPCRRSRSRQYRAAAHSSPSRPIFRRVVVYMCPILILRSLRERIEGKGRPRPAIRKLACHRW